MGIISYFKRKRDDYLMRGIDRVEIPDFKDGDIIRKRLIFTGKVQGVGFRFETYHIATRIGLTGWVKNMADGRVKGEVQGTKEKIDFLIEHLRALKRAKVEDVKVEDMEVIKDEREFEIVD